VQRLQLASLELEAVAGVGAAARSGSRVAEADDRRGGSVPPARLVRRRLQPLVRRVGERKGRERLLERGDDARGARARGRADVPPRLRRAGVEAQLVAELEALADAERAALGRARAAAVPARDGGGG
jgi:hypothetical protein